MPYWLADSRDYWLRHLVEGRNRTLRATHPRVKPRYLQNQFELVTGKPWALEMSGRALSLTGDIRARADAAAAAIGKPGFRFHDLIYVSVHTVRTNPNLDIFIEPVAGDEAHANFVIKQRLTITYRNAADHKEPHEIFRQISGMLHVCDASDLGPIENLRQQR